MHNLNQTLASFIGEKSQRRYTDIIEMLIDLYGEEIASVEMLYLKEVETYDVEQGTHALNSMLFDLIEQCLLQNGISLNEDEIVETNLFLLFDIFEGVVRLDGWELYDELLTIINDEDIDDSEDRFVFLLERVIDIKASDVLNMVDEVDEVFFETIEEELLHVKSTYENSFELDPEELRVFKVDDRVRHILRMGNEDVFTKQWIKQRRPFPQELGKEELLVLATIPLEEAIRHLTLTVIMQYPELDNTELRSKAMDHVKNMAVNFRRASTMSVGVMRLLKELEERYG